MILPPIVVGLAIVLASVLVLWALYWRRDCLRAESSLKLTETALEVATVENIASASKIKEYGEDRIKRGDELAEMGGKLAWFTHFLEHITNPPNPYATMLGSRWQLVETQTISLIREVLGEIAGDWDTFEAALIKEAERRRVESATKMRPTASAKRDGRRPKRSRGGTRRVSA